MVNFGYQFESVQQAKTRGKVILIPSFLENMEVEDDVKAIFHLLVVCHEIAHVMHEHTQYKDTDYIDSIGIELWADYYAMRAAMSVLNFRKRFRDSLTDKYDGDTLIITIGKAIVLLSQTYYVSSSKSYPSLELRARTSMTGITSFLTRLDCAINLGRFVNVTKLVFTEAGLSNYFGAADVGEYESKVISRIREVHLKILGSRYSITSGIQPKYQKFLGTEFV